MDFLKQQFNDALYPNLQWMPIFSYEDLEIILASMDYFRSDHPLLTPILIGKN